MDGTEERNRRNTHTCTHAHYIDRNRTSRISETYLAMKKKLWVSDEEMKDIVENNRV
jgi:hypothetical protein